MNWFESFIQWFKAKLAVPVLDTDQFSEEEIFAKTLDGEAANQGRIGQQAVANTIMRRVALQWQGETTVRGVCLRRKQYSCWNPGQDRDRIMKETNPQCLLIAQLAMAGSLSDLTAGADSYIVRDTPCYWAKGLMPVASIGVHDFYVTRHG